MLAVSLVREAGIPGQSDNLMSPISRHCSCGNLDWAWAEWEGYDWCAEAGVSRFDASRNQINQMHLMNFVCSPRGVAVISRLLCPLCLLSPQGHAVEEHDDYEFTSARCVQGPVNISSLCMSTLASDQHITLMNATHHIQCDYFSPLFGGHVRPFLPTPLSLLHVAGHALYFWPSLPNATCA